MDKRYNSFSTVNNLKPISVAEFDIIFSHIVEKKIFKIAVAVSGGPDSLALTWLLRNWCVNQGVRLTALTVDHGIQPNSTENSRKVCQWLKSWDVDCQILTWFGEKPNTKIQENARINRYKLMLDWCIQNDFENLALAHHQEDQAETFLIRILRGSGSDGLACMQKISKRRGVRLLRPVLAVPKSRLLATLKLQNQECLDDPANTNPMFTRTLIRNLTGSLAERGFDTTRLANLSGQFGQLRMRFEELTELVIDRAVNIYPTGWASVDSRILMSLPDEVGRRVIIYLIRSIGGRPYPPRRKALDRLTAFLGLRDKFTAHSLGGCSIRRTHKNRLMILREEINPKRIKQISSAGCVMWRGIFQCRFTGIVRNHSQNLRLLPLGSEGWVQLVNKNPELRNSNIPYRVVLTLPALFDDIGVISAPHLNYHRCQKNTGLNSNNINFIEAKFVPLDHR